MKMDEDNPVELLRSLAAKSSCIQLVYDWASCETPAIYTWKNEEDYRTRTCSYHDWFICQLNEMQLPESSVIPNLIQDQIEYHIMSILNQVTKWISYHHRLNFFHDEPTSSLKEYLLKLVWKPDRSIDYTETAINILTSSTNFNSMERYRFACTYCFPKDVWNLRDMAPVAIDWDFEEEPLVVYWSKYLANQLHTISLPAYASIDVVMFAKALKEYDLWRPIQYFFAKLNSGLKVWQFGNVITNGGDRKYRTDLLAQLTDGERSLVYRDQMETLLKTYVKSDNLEGIRQLYSELKNDLSMENFVLLIEELALCSMKNYRNFNELTPLLMAIWNQCNDECEWMTTTMTGLQSRIAEKCVDLIELNAKSIFQHRDRYEHPLVFIRALAAACNPRSFLKSNFYWLVIWQPFARVVELIEEFQLDAEYVEKLRKNTRKSHKMEYASVIYLECGEFAEFGSFVSFCYAGFQTNSLAQQALVSSLDGLDALSTAMNRIDWRLVYEFVRNVFRDSDGGIVANCTTLLMFHALGKDDCFLKQMMNRGEAISIVECIRTFVPHEGIYFSQAKMVCLDLFFVYLHNHADFVFKSALFEDLLIWGYGMEADVARFRDKINVSKIFITQLGSCVDEYTFRATDSIEEFLRWYFPVESERKVFKLGMIYSYGEFGIIAGFLKQRRYRRSMLNWFFDNNAYEMTEFVTRIYV